MCTWVCVCTNVCVFALGLRVDIAGRGAAGHMGSGLRVCVLVWSVLMNLAHQTLLNLDKCLNLLCRYVNSIRLMQPLYLLNELIYREHLMLGIWVSLKNCYSFYFCLFIQVSWLKRVTSSWLQTEASRQPWRSPDLSQIQPYIWHIYKTYAFKLILQCTRRTFSQTPSLESMSLGPFYIFNHPITRSFRYVISQNL